MNEFSIRAGDLVDCLDADLIWSLGRVKEINRGRGEAQVGYYGWGAEWDEWISLSASRLAPPTTYSSSSLCFVKLPRGPTWPAKVYIRRPQPGSDHAKSCLRQEPKILVELFSPPKKYPSEPFWHEVAHVRSFSGDFESDAARSMRTAGRNAMAEARESNLPALRLHFEKGTLLALDSLLDANGQLPPRGSLEVSQGRKGGKRKREIADPEGQPRFFGVEQQAVRCSDSSLYDALAVDAGEASEADPPALRTLWRAFHRDGRKEYSFGVFEDPEHAARIRDECVWLMQCSARLNYPAEFACRPTPTRAVSEDTAAYFLVDGGQEQRTKKARRDDANLVVQKLCGQIWRRGSVRIYDPSRGSKEAKGSKAAAERRAARQRAQRIVSLGTTETAAPDAPGAVSDFAINRALDYMVKTSLQQGVFQKGFRGTSARQWISQVLNTSQEGVGESLD
uniref:PWWP domain-containing protein n=1 Tax=Pinguiococcus pyrenoidosus TaxID=172671 RepID=A0A6U0U3Y7_9STRA|mmetsp:Transcript_13061/g.48480  ORF Transcript_13061/g.48480 Transcript_13061/m.48480 type:complete len:451 (+) Transcript_13061:185-1537(+)